MRTSIMIAAAAVLLATPAMARAGTRYYETWHGGSVGVDICFNQNGAAFEGERWRFSGVAIPCFAVN